MSGKQAYPSSTGTQSGAVQSVKGAVVNQTGNTTETAQAASWFTNNTIAFNHVDEAYVFEFLLGQMVLDHVPTCGWSYYIGIGSNTTRVGGHMVTVGSVMITPSSSKYITYHDPGTGYTQEISYDSFREDTINGIRHVWTASVCQN